MLGCAWQLIAQYTLTNRAVDDFYFLQYSFNSIEQYFSRVQVLNSSPFIYFIYIFIYKFTELTPEQQKLLIELRRKKQELLLHIQVGDNYFKNLFEMSS